MTISVEATLVVGNTVTETDPADAVFFDLLAATTAGPQIAPESEFPIIDPFTGATLRFLDGVVIGSELNGLKGTGTATAGALLLENASDINLSDETTLIVFTFEQPDGSQLVIRAMITGGDGPTLQEFADGYTVEDLLMSADTVNGESYTFDPGSEVGTDDPDDLVGDAGADTFRGGPGDDTITGAGGNDTLRGGADNDLISGGAGGDDLYGGQGRDTLNGGGGRDELFGGVGADLLRGGGGNDTLRGEQGRDDLAGGAGRDLLIGGSGGDHMSGGAGRDRLIGGAGDDTMMGGGGRDTFVFLSGHQRDGQLDTITDFELGVDKLRIAGSDYDDLVITDTDAGAEIAIGDYTILVEAVSAADLSATDFL